MFRIESTHGMWDVENIHRDNGIERDKVRDYGNPIGDSVYGQSSILAKKQ